MQQVLYRKYRSKSFRELLGQDNIVRVLKQSVKDDRIAHAYLFAGPRGTGKTSTARILAKAINCLNPKDGEPCNKCSSCLAINEGKFLDLIEIDAASNRGIDEIRQLKEKVSFLPAEGKYKTYIIDEVHMLTTEAFNALLKTLEEPPDKVIFILATTEAHKLPLTILSRTQRFDFRLAGDAELRAKLEKITAAEGYKISTDGANLIINAGQGSFRDAETVLEKVLSALAEQKSKELSREMVEQVLGFTSAEFVRKIYDSSIAGDHRAALETLRQAEESGVNYAQLVKQLLEYARVELLNKVSGEESGPDLGRITQFIKEFSLAAQEQKNSPLQQLPLEMAIIRLNNGSTTSIDSKPVTAPKTVMKSEPVAAIAPLETKVEVALPHGELKLEQLLEHWQEVLSEARAFNHQMVAFLLNAKVISVNGNELLLQVPFEFHKKRLEERRSQDVFKQISSKIYASELILICEVNKELSNRKPGSNSNSTLVEEVFSDML
jgi:DNA polymerase-3 subunit gamma/tau